MGISPILSMLQEIRTDTFRNAAPLPLKQSAQPERQGLGLQIGGVRLVSPLGEVIEILKMPKIAHLPGVKPWVLGIANVRGRLIPVIDLHGLLGMTPTLPMSQWRVMVIETEDLVAGLVVEQSLGMQHFVEESYEESVGDGLEVLGPYIQGGYRHAGRVYHEIHLKEVLRDEKFFDVAD